jgi:hypothetical protein
VLVMVVVGDNVCSCELMFVVMRYKVCEELMRSLGLVVERGGEAMFGCV